MAWDDEDNKDGGNAKGHGPWGSREPGQQPGKPKNPWDPQRPLGQDDVPDLDALLRQAQEKLGSIFGGGGGKKPPSDEGKKGLGLLLLLIAVLWLSTGFYRVQPGDSAVLLTFGEWTSTRSTPGLGYHIPWPVQSVVSVDVSRIRRIQIGFRDQPGTDKADAAPGRSDISSESQMLTGDEKIVDLDFVVLWNIGDAKNYLFRIRDPEETVKKVAESAMRETIGHSQAQSVLTGGRAEIEANTKELMQKMLDQYQSGVIINSVQLLSVDPPAEVIDAYNDVQRAHSDMERAKNEADAYANGIVPVAKGNAQKITQDAEAYKEAVLSKAKGDAARFTSVYNAYVESKDVTAKRIYIETMEEIMQNSKKVLVDGKGGNVLPYLSLDRLQGTAKQETSPAPATAATQQ